MYGPPTYRDQHVVKNQPTAMRVIDISSELVRTNYETYRAAMPSSALMWSWGELTQPVREAWQKAALAVRDQDALVIDGVTARASIGK